MLVVIAILAILATVAVMGYTSFTEKAQKSVDFQLAEQLNTVLHADEVLDGKPQYLSEVFDILREADVEVPDGLKPTYAKHSFVWDSQNNVILVVEDNTVVYPEEYAGNNAEELVKNSNLAIPTAKLTADLDGEEIPIGDVYVHQDEGLVDGDTYQLDAIYTFETTSVPDEYMDYYVDFVIEVHDDLENVAIAGKYAGYPWIAIEMLECPADLSAPLLGSFAGLWTYRDIVSNVGTFYCAIANHGGDNTGAQVTVKLCLWENETDAENCDMSKAIVVNVIEYTFD